MTAQIHERLILDGTRTSMTTCPDLPLHDPRLVEVDPEMRTRATGDAEALTRSTACWRGYQATWEVKDDRLYLVNIVGAYRLTTREPLFADWVSGILVVPQGELLEYVHMGFDSIYERELELFVEAGVVTEREVIDHDP